MKDDSPKPTSSIPRRTRSYVNNTDNDNPIPKKRIKFEPKSASTSMGNWKVCENKVLLKPSLDAEDKKKVQNKINDAIDSSKSICNNIFDELHFLQSGLSILHINKRKKVIEKPHQLVKTNFFTSDDSDDSEPEYWTAEEIINRVKAEHRIINRIIELKKADLWSEKMLPKKAEPPLPMFHWQYLLKEMKWYHSERNQEKIFKRRECKNIAATAVKYLKDKKSKIVKLSKDETAKAKKHCATVAKMIKEWWKQMERIVLAKHKFRIDARRQEAINTHLEKVMETTEKYTEWLTEDLKHGNVSDADQSTEDPEFKILTETEDERDHIISDEENFEASSTKSNKVSSSDLEEGEVNEELESLIKQNDQCLDDILQELPEEYLKSITGQKTDDYNEKKIKTQKKKPQLPLTDKEEGECDDSDEEVTIPSDEEDDDEETLAEQEKHENIASTNDSNNNEDLCIHDTVNDELNELHEDADLPIEKLLEKYNSLYNIENVALDKQEKTDGDESDVETDSGSSCTESNKESDSSSESEHTNLLEELVMKKDKEVEETKEDNKLEGKFSEIADIAISTQPLGFTLESTEVKVQVPFLLKHSLREYQHVGLDWLAAIYEKRLNGVLADEMGLGKTIQTISLLAYMACEKGIWGPHLIIVPTSVILNWECELKKWCPGFKILTYYGGNKDRLAKRKGWTKPNAFHVCITSYKLAIQDSAAFKRKKWKYMILDEAQNIKNFKSQRWQTLLTFNSQRRLLLTGTPLQNNLMELWSLMHFLMPNIFQNHREFNDWFGNPMSGMIEGNKDYNEQLVLRLHKVLRPFILRRLKKDVEKQLPQKVEHIVMCPLSKRQRFLYDDFMSLTSTKETLAGGQFMSIINILMQLRKVCNHPNLFEERPVISPFIMSGNNCLQYNYPKLCILENVYNQPTFTCQPRTLLDMASNLPSFVSQRIKGLIPRPGMIEEIDTIQPVDWIDKYKEKYGNISPDKLSNETNTVFISRPMTEYLDNLGEPSISSITVPKPVVFGQKIRKISVFKEMSDSNTISKKILEKRSKERCVMLKELENRNKQTCLYLSESYLGPDLVNAVQIRKKCPDSHVSYSEVTGRIWEQTLLEGYDFIKRAICTTLPVITRPVIINTTSSILKQSIHQSELMYDQYYSSVPDVSIRIRQNLLVQFPETRLIEYDCGKLQILVILLNRLKSEGHRCLIFTQMTRMLDVLEQFLSYHGYKYLRLDGTTKVEQRQLLMERFNKDDRIFVFILSTRSGGVGVNLTGADTVIFYDSDWNPTIDAQAQDRCHRIGQTRDVHIYRLISSRTVEENILKKANEKRCLSEMAIEGGQFNMTYFKNANIDSKPESAINTNSNGGLFVDIFQNPTGFTESSENENSNKEKPLIENNENEYKSRKGRKIKWKGDTPLLKSNQTKNNQSESNTAKMNQLELESALEQAEEESDRLAAKTLRAEATAELAEFDESVPWMDESGNGAGNEDAAEKFRYEMELQLQNLNQQLAPLQRYGVNWLELTNEDALVDELQNEETQIESNKQEWQLDQIKALHEDDEIKKDIEEDDMMFVSGGFDPYAAQRRELEKLKYEELLVEYQQEQALLNESTSQSLTNITPFPNNKRQKPTMRDVRGRPSVGRRGRKKITPRNSNSNLAAMNDSQQSINLPERLSRNTSIDYSSEYSDNVPLKIACTPPYQTGITHNYSSDYLMMQGLEPAKKVSRRGRPRGGKSIGGSYGNSSQNSPARYPDSLLYSDDNSRDSSYKGSSMASYANGIKSESFYNNSYNAEDSSMLLKATEMSQNNNGFNSKAKRGRIMTNSQKIVSMRIPKPASHISINNSQSTLPMNMPVNQINLPNNFNQPNQINLPSNSNQPNQINLPSNSNQPNQSDKVTLDRPKIKQDNFNTSSATLNQDKEESKVENLHFKIPVQTLNGEYKRFSAGKFLTKTRPVFIVTREIEATDPETGLSEIFRQSLTYPVDVPDRYAELSNKLQKAAYENPKKTTLSNIPLKNYVNNGQLKLASNVTPTKSQNPNQNIQLQPSTSNFVPQSHASTTVMQYSPNSSLAKNTPHSSNFVPNKNPTFFNGYQG